MEPGQTLWIIHTSIQLFSWGKTVPSNPSSFLGFAHLPAQEGPAVGAAVPGHAVASCPARCPNLQGFSHLSHCPVRLGPPQDQGEGGGLVWMEIRKLQRQQNCADAAPANEAANLKPTLHTQSYLLQVPISFIIDFNKNIFLKY